MTTVIAQHLGVGIALLSTAVGIVATFRWLWISPVLGYFAAGMLISEYNLIPYSSGVESFAELGVVFLLFVIGAEMSLPRIRKMRRYVLGVGGIQYFFSAILIALAARLFGCSWSAAYVIGSGIATSSTAIVMGLVSSGDSALKRISEVPISILLFQDIAVVPALVVLPILASGDGSVSGVELATGLMRAAMKAVIALAGIFVFGRLLLRRIFRAMDLLGLTELFTATTLLIVLSAAYTTEYFGLSMALGAFMAGSMVAETEYVKRVESVVIPFKSLLLGLFFITVGMSFDIRAVINDWHRIALASIGIIVTKAIIIFIACRIFKVSVGASVNVALLLAQGSEFAFVLFDMAGCLGIMDDRLSNIAMSSTTITMTLTPVLAAIGKVVHKAVDRVESDAATTNQHLDKMVEHMKGSGFVLVIGLGYVGSSVVKQLRDEEVPYLAIDINTAAVDRALSKGLRAVCTDAAQIELYKNTVFSSAVCALITVGNVYTAKKLLVGVLKGIPELKVVVRVSDVTKWNYDGIEDSDKDRVVLASDKAEVAIRIASEVRSILSDEDEVRFLTKYYQEDGYNRLLKEDGDDK